MHEFHIVGEIVRVVLEEVRKRGAEGVEEINLEIGELMMLSDEPVLVAFEALSKGTPLEGSKLVIHNVKAQVSCKECGYLGGVGTLPQFAHHESPIISCPQCSGEVEVLSGRECVVRKVALKLQD